MRTRGQDFNAGMAALVIVVFIGSLISEHGKRQPASTVTWWDLIQILFFIAVFALCVIDIYKYWKNLK